MEYATFPIRTNIFQNQATLVIKNGIDGLMDVTFSPNCNGGYEHKNVQMKGDWCNNQKIDVQGRSEKMIACTFYSRSTTQLEIYNAPNDYHNIIAAEHDLLDKMKDKTKEEGIRATAHLYELNMNELTEAFNQSSQVDWFSYLWF